VEQKQYEQAVPNLTQILLQYTDTSASADAKKLLPQVYAGWAVALREAGNFEVAEQKLLEFQSWSQNEGQAELAVEARRHLARTYIDWSLALLAHEHYETALDKLDLAVKSDPHSDFESASEERSTRRKVYVGWGNDFLKRDDIATAINKFKQAVSLADGGEDDGARDALTGALVRSAAGLSEKEDFQAAIEQLELAEASARSDETKQSVATALSDTYLAFSKSSGPQARIALREAMDTICKKHKKPELPIFGINPDLIRMSSNTADVKLPDDMIARTPGEMHYVVCTEIDNKIVDSRKHMQIVQKTSRGYYYRFVAQYRAQMIWNVTLYDVSTGESMATIVLTGGTPPPFPDGPYDGGGYTYGTPPPMEELLKWLKAATAD
jgi:tetratricopeptide (TPR) repeat protein